MAASVTPSWSAEVEAETAEAAFRRVAKRKLAERGCPEDQVEARLTRLLSNGLALDPRLLDSP